MSDLGIDSNYILSSATDLNYSSKSNTINTSSSSNSLHFNEDEEEDEYSPSKQETLETGFATAKSLSANSINTGSELIVSLTSSLTRTNPSSSSSSSTTSSSSSSEHHPVTKTNNKYVFLLNAFVNGFAQLKLSAEKTDYEYIIEIYWSNEARTYVKRTYDDFVIFHRHLLQTFSQFFNEIKSNVNSSPKSVNSSNVGRMGNELCLMPVLPAAKKPFWVSQLKLAESREIELNNYVQRILKLPTEIAHSDSVLKFFESQTSDPKPANSQKNYGSAPTADLICEIQEISVSNINLSRNSNQFYEYGDDDDDEEYDAEEYDENEEDCQYSRNTARENNYNNMPISHSLIGLNQCVSSRKQSVNREAGLWWDEDEALNELTSSMSFEFGSGGGVGQYAKISFEDLNDDGSDDLETLKTLEKILKNSELFRGEASASTSTLLRQACENNNNANQSGKRLSLS